MTRLGDSLQRTMPLLTSADLAADEVVAELLSETVARRQLDLSDLTPREQAELITTRAVDLLPSTEALAAAIASKGKLTVKLGIDPNSADVHLGHAVPVIVLSRFQRMGHHVVLIIGDTTAKIGDPSGRSSERPVLTDEDIAANLSTYRDQISPFFDFGKVDYRQNSDWLARVTLPELVGVLSQLPVSALLQREDFRDRLATGHGLAMSEFIYPVAMALDSVAIHADVEIGGVDQLLNLQMGRRVQEISGQSPQVIATMPLIEGTDGTGAKMSKSAGNYVGLTAGPDEIYGKLMSIPDRLTLDYLKAWSEWTDSEIDAVTTRQADGSLHPMDLKRIVAGEAVAAINGIEAAAAARAGFTAQFSRRTFGDVAELPLVSLPASGEDSVGAVLVHRVEFAPSMSAARRTAKQNGLRLIAEGPEGGQESIVLGEEAVTRPIREVVTEVVRQAGQGETAAWRWYLKLGRKLARVEV